MKDNHVDPIPESFGSLEEAGEFWDSHDTMDYQEALKTVEATTELRNRYYEVEIEMSVAQALRDQARRRGITTSDLATEMLRRQLAVAG